MIVLKIFGGFALIVLIIAGLSIVVDIMDAALQEAIEEIDNEHEQKL